MAGWLAVAVVFLVFLTLAYRAWTASRMDRLHDRCVAARASLDVQLIHRAAAAGALERDHGAELGSSAAPLRAAVRAVQGAAGEPPASLLDRRELVENDLTRRLRDLPWPAGDPRLEPVTVAARRVLVARQIYNDAVRDSLALRRRRLPRALGLSARRPEPHYFDVDDSLPGSVRPASDGANTSVWGDCAQPY
ncbi:hypothetical protein [Fodinicola acaciae]|uniref:hypothetical protein n=1 Tax=Fodinicola acaciae TaxID=2681555 RepID=UPI001651D04A|nr:hypothetical protein [Fodinicola acaciae]